MAVGVTSGVLIAVLAFPDTTPDLPTAFGEADGARLQSALSSGDPGTVTGAVELPANAGASDELVRGLASMRPQLDAGTIVGQEGGAATVEAVDGAGRRWLLLVRLSPAGWRVASTAPLS